MGEVLNHPVETITVEEGKSFVEEVLTSACSKLAKEDFKDLQGAVAVSESRLKAEDEGSWSANIFGILNWTALIFIIYWACNQ